MANQQIPPYRQVAVTLQDDGSYLATWPTQRLRFLLSDGRTIDVESSRDDSDLRAAVLEATKAERIEGVVTLKDESPKAPSKRVARRS
jgi:hypothetical protein